jgi:hypothetical protein
MRSVLLEVQTEETLNILQSYIDDNEQIIAWQLKSKDERLVDLIKLTQIEGTDKLIFSQNNPKEKIYMPGTIYCFVPSKNTIFKFKFITYENSFVTTELPMEVKLLDESDTNLLDQKYDYKRNKPDFYIVKGNKKTSSHSGPDIMKVKSISKHDMDIFNEELGAITLDQEEKMFAGSRETPRARPKKDKIVNVKRSSDTEGKSYLLFDLSQGGLSFIVNLEDNFNKGDQLEILGFDLKVFDEPMVGQIMSIRPLDELGFQNKIGIKFIG